jgi:ABC-type sugar transport system ATPase subunit
VLGIRPESISPIKIEGLANNSIYAIIKIIEPLGDRMDVYLDTQSDEKLVANIDPHTKLRVEEKCTIYIDTNRLHIFEPGDAGRNICL